MKNEIKFMELMTGLGELFDKTISDPLKNIYWKILEPFPDEDCEKAFNQIIATCKFFPKPVEFLEILRGRSEDDSTRAWILVDEAMRKHGNYSSLDFGEPKIHRIVEMLGGWDYLGTITEEEWKWKRKEFESLYQAIKRPDGPDWVIGICEKANEPRGFESPKLISLAEKKQKLLK